MLRIREVSFFSLNVSFSQTLEIERDASPSRLFPLRALVSSYLLADSPLLLSPLLFVFPARVPDLTNAVKIRRGKETSIFRTERNEDKRALLASFRQVAEALANKKRNQIEKEQERRRSMWQGDARLSLDTLASRSLPRCEIEADFDLSHRYFRFHLTFGRSQQVFRHLHRCLEEVLEGSATCLVRGVRSLISEGLEE